MRGVRGGRHVALDVHPGLGPSLDLGLARYFEFFGVNLWALEFDFVVLLMVIPPNSVSNLKTLLVLEGSGADVAPYSKGMLARPVY